jgi:hypothetical protein
VVLRLLRRLPAVEGAQAQGCQQVLLLLEALWRKTNTSLAPPFQLLVLALFALLLWTQQSNEKTKNVLIFPLPLFF